VPAVVASTAVHQPSVLQVVVVHADTVGWGTCGAVLVAVVPRLGAVLVPGAVRGGVTCSALKSSHTCKRSGTIC
jgi:hypothetical protein